MHKTLPYPWTPRDARGAKIALWASHTDALRQEEFNDSSGAYVGTPVGYGQPVGTVFLCQEGHVFTALSSAYRPTLQFDASGGRNSFFRFGASGQASALILQNSTGALRFINDTQVYTICFWLRMKNDGNGIGGSSAVQSILDSNSDSNSLVGLNFQWDPGPLVYWQTSKASNWLTDFSAAGITVPSTGGAGTWVPVVIRSKGAGTGTVTLGIGGSVTGGVFVPTIAATGNAIVGAPLGTDAGHNLYVGGTASNGEHGQFDLDSLLIADCILDASDLTNWYNFNPAQNAGTLARCSTSGSEADPEELSHLFGDWDMTRARHPLTDQQVLFQDAAATTAITAGNQTLGYVENRLGSHLKRWLSFTSSLGAAPTWQIGTLSVANPFALPCAFFNGSGSGSTTSPNSLTFNQALPPGDKTIIMVMQQNNNGPSDGSDAGMVGSHLLNYSGSSSTYLALGGSYHASPSNLQLHPTGTAGSSYNGLQCPAVTTITMTGVTTPTTAGTYVLVEPTTALGNTQTGYFYYFCAAQGMYLWWNSSQWVLGATLGLQGSAPRFVSPHQYQIASYTATGTGASGSPVATIAAGGGNTAIGMNIYHLRQKGGYIQGGINGVWSSYFGDSSGNPLSISMAFDNLGNDSHYNGATPNDSQHFELTAFVEKVLVYNYAHSDRWLNKVFRRLGNRFGIQGMTLSS